MTARFLALYEKPADPEAFDRHYREIHIPLGHRLPGCAGTRSAVTSPPSGARRTSPTNPSHLGVTHRPAAGGAVACPQLLL